ncbi:MAG: ABC transporter permease [Pseudomonadota bacterium]
MLILSLAFKSLFNRRISALLTIISIAFSITLLLGVERISDGARKSFESTLSGTDLIVGARGGSTQLLLYTVFRVGNPVNNISWESYQNFAQHREVAWTIPITLGDSHRGFRVIGTNQDYFKHYRYGRKKNLSFAEGQMFEDVFDAVLGADVAAELGYELNQNIVLAHGITEVSFQQHEDKPFRVVGILTKTGTPVDRAIHVSLEGIEAMHIDWQNGVPPRPGEGVAADAVRTHDLTPTSITAFLIGLRSKFGIFHVQRAINEYPDEPLTAILPGVTLGDLWRTVNIADIGLRIISAFVVLTGLIGMLTAILTTLNERRREMAILRSVGAGPRHIFGLLVFEALLLTLFGCLLGLVLLYLMLFIAQPLIETQFGMFLPVSGLSIYDLSVLGMILFAALLMSSLPAWRAYRQSLADGLSVQV